MPGGIGVNEAVIGVGLELEFSSSGREYSPFRGFQVIDEEIEVHLHGDFAVRPGWRNVIVDLLERDLAVPAGHRRPMGTAIRGSSGDFGVKRRERESIRGVDRDSAEGDLVGHVTTVERAFATIPSRIGIGSDEHERGS